MPLLRRVTRLAAVLVAGVSATGCDRRGPASPTPNSPSNTAPSWQPSAVATPSVRPTNRPVVLPQLLEPGEYNAEVLDLDTTPRLAALSEQMTTAMGQHGQWLKQYVAEKAEPDKPLPYHPNFGLTADEYRELLNLYDKQQLQVVDRFQLAVEVQGDRLTFRTPNPRYTYLDSIKIDLATGQLETVAGPAGTPTALDPTATIRTFGRWEGVEWKRSSGDLTWEGDSVTLVVGRTPSTGHVVVEYRLDIVDTGQVVRQARLIFRFTPVVPEPQKGRRDQ